MVDYVKEIKSKKSCKYGKHGLFEPFLCLCYGAVNMDRWSMHVCCDFFVILVKTVLDLKAVFSCQIEGCQKECYVKLCLLVACKLVGEPLYQWLVRVSSCSQAKSLMATSAVPTMQNTDNWKLT